MHKIHIQDDDGRTTVVPFVADVITIGRNVANTIQLTERNVSRDHARIFRSNNSVYIEDINSSYGTLVNGDPISKATHVRPGDIVQIGDYRIRCREDLGDASNDARPSSTEPVPMAGKSSTPLREAQNLPGDNHALLRPTEPSVGREFAISQTCTTIGSASNNDWVLDHPSVDAHHAEILFENDQFVLTNLTDSQSVHVNHEPYERLALQPGDEIRIGNVEVQFMMGASVAPAWTESFTREIDEDEIPSDGNKKMLAVAGVLLVVAIALGLLYVFKLSKPRVPVESHEATASAEKVVPEASPSLLETEPKAKAEAGGENSEPAPRDLLQEARDKWAAGAIQDAHVLLDEAESVPDLAEEAREIRAEINLEKKLSNLSDLIDNEKYEAALEYASAITVEDGPQLSKFQTLREQAVNSRLAELLVLGTSAVGEKDLSTAERWLREMQKISATAEETVELTTQIRNSRRQATKPRPRGKAKATPKKSAAKPVTKPAPPKAVEKPPAPAAEPPPAPAPPPVKITSNPTEMYKTARRIFRKNPDGAVKLLLEVVRLKPGHSGAHKKLGIYYQTSGNKSKAAKHYRKYLELKPNAADAAAISATLQRLE